MLVYLSCPYFVSYVSVELVTNTTACAFRGEFANWRQDSNRALLVLFAFWVSSGNVGCTGILYVLKSSLREVSLRMEGLAGTSIPC
jgi:hypothetical protein